MISSWLKSLSRFLNETLLNILQNLLFPKQLQQFSESICLTLLVPLQLSHSGFPSTDSETLGLASMDSFILKIHLISFEVNLGVCSSIILHMETILVIANQLLFNFLLSPSNSILCLTACLPPFSLRL